jgi:hypothetical protein
MSPCRSQTGLHAAGDPPPAGAVACHLAGNPIVPPIIIGGRPDVAAVIMPVVAHTPPRNPPLPSTHMCGFAGADRAMLAAARSAIAIAFINALLVADPKFSARSSTAFWSKTWGRGNRLRNVLQPQPHISALPPKSGYVLSSQRCPLGANSLDKLTR